MLDTKTEVDLGKLKVLSISLDLCSRRSYVLAVKPSAEVLLSLNLERLAKYCEKREKFTIPINTCCPKDTTASVRLL